MIYKHPTHQTDTNDQTPESSSCCNEHSEHNHEHQPHETTTTEQPRRFGRGSDPQTASEQKQTPWLAISIAFAGVIISSSILYSNRDVQPLRPKSIVGTDASAPDTIIDEEQVLPSQGIELPFAWRDLGIQLTKTGVIDKKQFEALYQERGGMPADMKALLENSDNDKIRITRENAPIILNIAWALGLGNKNRILEQGPMSDPQYGGAKVFASTAGWTLSKGDAMNHYSSHEFIRLTEDQQSVVERVSQTIYRPCCGNSTYFPDCNHGMAMLGLLELMASQNVSEDEMYRSALAINSYWFPDTYLTIAKFKKINGTNWTDVNPREVLGANFSSSNGYRQIASQVTPAQSKGGGGCGV